MTRELRLIAASLLLWGTGEGMYIHFQPLYLQQLGADPVQIGGILGLASLGLVITHIPAGALADRFGRRVLIRAAWFLGAAAAWAMFLAPNLPLFTAGLVFYFFTAFVMSPMSSYITAARGDWTTARALTTVFAFFAIGSILGPIIGGQLSGIIGIRSLYAVSASLYVISAIMVLFLPAQPRENIPLRSGYSRLLRNKAFGRLLALFSLTNLALFLTWPLLPNFMQNERGLNLATIGIIGSFNAAGGVVLNLLIGRMSNRPAYLLAQWLVLGSSLILWLGTGTPMFALGYFLSGGYRTYRSITTAVAETQVDRPQMGLAYGLVETAVGLTTVAAAPIAGLLYREAPYLPFPVSLLLIAVSLTISTRWLPRDIPSSEEHESGRD
jgi:MFS family permease